jgi:hypothetical protein
MSTVERPLPSLNADERTTLEDWLGRKIGGGPGPPAFRRLAY